MSGSEREIVCRKCRERISIDLDNCPHCGTSIRGFLAPAAAIAIGVIVVGAALTSLEDLGFFALVGAGLILVGGYLLYEKRQRIRAV